MLPGGVFSNKYASELAVLRTKTQWVLLAIIVLFFLAIVPQIASAYWLTQLTLVGITLMICLGLHILAGLTGMISIGQAGSVAIGAYTVAILTTRYDLNGWLCLPICALAAGFVGILIGLPSFRLKLFYLAIATWACQEIIIWVLRYRDFWDYTGGFTGLQMDPLSLNLGFTKIDFGSDMEFYLLTVVFVIIAAFVALNIGRSNTGRIFVAIRDNELAAEVAGIHLFRNKLLAFFIASAFAGIAGWLWAYSQLRVNPSQFNFHDSMFYMGMIIIGGLGNLGGVFAGVFMFEIGEIVNSDYLSPFLVDNLPARWSAQIYVSLRLVLGGMGILMFMKFAPRGIAGMVGLVKLAYRSYPYSFRGG